MADDEIVTAEGIPQARDVDEAEAIVRALITNLIDAPPETPVEPVYPMTALPEGLGEAITPASLAVACAEALDMGEHWQWGEWRDDYGPGRKRFIPAIPVRHRWKVGKPPELWIAGGPCQSYPAAFLADWTLLLDDGAAGRVREMKRRPAEPTGWRARWARRFPPSGDPAIRPADRLWRPPPGYFKIARGDAYHGE